MDQVVKEVSSVGGLLEAVECFSEEKCSGVLISHTLAYGTYLNCLTAGYVSFRLPTKVPILVLTVRLDEATLRIFSYRYACASLKDPMHHRIDSKTCASIL